ncbi:MAG TPA: FliH/SctL family protein [Bacillota bacterium]|nr:FliH/SctL family protein [Bacillota bacterium]
MSKPSTRVIKANQLNVDLSSVPPKIVGITALPRETVSFPEELEVAASADEEVLIEEPDIPSASEEAAKILAETETMVRELMDSARRQVEENLQQAREDAENIVLEARDEVEALKEQAWEEGYRQGFNKALEDAAAQADELRAQAQEVLKSARAEHDLILKDTESEIIGLVLAIAEKVIKSEIAVRTELVGQMVREAILKATDREELVIRVNPGDLEYVNCLSEELRKENPGMRSLRIIGDNVISPGGCVVETPNGSVDATLERQLSELREALMEVS